MCTWVEDPVFKNPEIVEDKILKYDCTMLAQPAITAGMKPVIFSDVGNLKEIFFSVESRIFGISCGFLLHF